MRSSQYSDIGMRGVDKWRNNLDSNQSVDFQNSESSLTKLELINVEAEIAIENLVNQIGRAHV